MLSKIIRNFVAKRVAGRTDDGIMITLSDPKKVDFQAAMLEDLLMRNGIDPKLIQTEDQLKNILNQIKAAEAQATATSGIRGSQSAKVFDLEGKEIPQGSQIMGGKATETEADIAARLREQNKDSVSRILERKNREDVYGLEDYDTTNMSDLQKELIRTETKLGNLNPDSPNFRERAKPLIDKIEDIQKKMKGGTRESVKKEAVEKYGITPERADEIMNTKLDESVLPKDPDFIDGPFDNKAEKLAEIKMSNEGFINDVINKINNMESIASMKEMNKVISKQGKYKNLTDEDVDKIFKATEDRTSGRLDEIDPDDYDPYQTGGRVGLKTGMSRRGFLKLMGGVGAGIGALKSGVLKMFGKEGAEQVTKEIVKTPPVAGKPEWFDSLVNKVITQGDDVSKNFAVQDRQVVHRVLLDKDGKAIDAKTADKIKQEGNVYDVEDITVTRNLDDGEIRVTYYSDKNMGAGDVELIYKPGQADEITKGKPPDTFQAAEAEPRVVNMDGDIEYDGENLVNNLEDLYSDTNKLKQFATDQKPTMKEFVESKKKQAIVEEVNSSDVGANEYLSNKYGDPIYQEPDIDPPEFASGGIANFFKKND